MRRSLRRTLQAVRSQSMAPSAAVPATGSFVALVAVQSLQPGALGEAGGAAIGLDEHALRHPHPEQAAIGGQQAGPAA